MSNAALPRARLRVENAVVEAVAVELRDRDVEPHQVTVPRCRHRFEVVGDEILDRIDEIVPPGTDVGTLDQACVPPALGSVDLRRSSISERAVA
jgi:hypothetical protein